MNATWKGEQNNHGGANIGSDLGGIGEGEGNRVAGPITGRDRRGAQRVRRNEWKYTTAGIEGGDGGGDSLGSPREAGGPQESMQVTFVEMPSSGDLEPDETTSRRYLPPPPPNRWGCYPTFNCF